METVPAVTESAPSGREQTRPLRQPALPVVHFSFGQRYGSVRVQQSIRVIERLCKQHGAVIDRLFERKWQAGWITVISIRSGREFAFEGDARAWWQSLMQQLQHELPHQHLLEKPLGEARFSFTTPQLLGLAGRLSAAVGHGRD
jgi:hypothetical protein